MLSTGIVRKLDTLGRVVLPKELRYSLDIQIAAPLEIFVDEDMILLKKYEPGCCLCQDYTSDLMDFKGKKLCGSCRKELKDNK